MTPVTLLRRLSGHTQGVTNLGPRESGSSGVDSRQDHHLLGILGGHPGEGKSRGRVLDDVTQLVVMHPGVAECVLGFRVNRHASRIVDAKVERQDGPTGRTARIDGEA